MAPNTTLTAICCCWFSLAVAEFGTLMSDPANAQKEAAVGVRIAGHETYWDRAEKSDGVWNTDELAQQQQQRDAFLAAGMQLVLEPGIHEPPAYVQKLPNGQFVSQTGTKQSTNVIWSTDVRTRLERYIRKLNETLNFSLYSGIRLGGAGDVEILYPGNSLYWAYDPVAQSTCPYPGWAPGDTSLSTAQVEQWYNWYLDAMISEIDWRRQLYISLGFKGVFHLVAPGVGAVPAVAQAAIEQHLVPYADVMGRGATWYMLLTRLINVTGTAGMTAWCSSTAEGYRQTDYTQPTDVSVDPLSAELSGWSSMRLMTYAAHRLDIHAGGENPGFGDSAPYGLPMLNASISQFIAGNWTSFMWAHDADLYAADRNITLADFAAAIARVPETAAR